MKQISKVVDKVVFLSSMKIKISYVIHEDANWTQPAADKIRTTADKLTDYVLLVNSDTKCTYVFKTESFPLTV